MILLAIDWPIVGIKTLQFLLSFSILVALHELGHFVAAKIFGCRVDKFYLFFDPWFSLFKKKIGETIYGIGWLPLGGYVKIAGMVDESMDKEQMKQPPKPYEFRSKPAWQRLIIMLAGVIVNLWLGFFIYSMILWNWGDQYLPTSEVKYGIATDSVAKSIGFKDGDKIVSIDGKQYEKFRDINKHLLLRKTHHVTVDRNGGQVNIPIPDNIAKTLIATKNVNFITPRVPLLPIEKVLDTASAAKAGIKSGDKIVAANGQTFQYDNEVRNFIKSHKGDTASLTVLRGADTLNINTPISTDGTLGVYFSVPELEKFFTMKKLSYNFFESIPAGYTKTWETLEDYWLQIKLIFGGKVAAKDSVGSLITIGSIFPATWDWQSFWSLTAFFSLVLAFMNLLPIPALDGGHALFCLYEMITGRKPSDKFMEVAQTVGMILLFGLMIFALGNDILRLFR
ncbi:RIP metalloprotease RseP [Haoranjiania flava]|uniref:Zinc metalloprotease n=1 Tax=Haoranjiania flava TaxID=1856322 RepID=A0AAE3LJ81_9BACT|nr:RIP metalloprotease RseP [Haoranjiania flava]MCU7693134.1 RIP metalloprotease RseP [Haoranjiania flava]